MLDRPPSCCVTLFDVAARPEVTIVGGGLAGSEAAWQAARRGARVRLHEMRPEVPTAAHQSGRLGEIVCSNSLKSDEPGTAPYLLKEELRRAGSLLISVAHEVAVPAGSALAVDRERFSERVTERLEAHPLVEISRAFEGLQRGISVLSNDIDGRAIAELGRR